MSKGLKPGYLYILNDVDQRTGVSSPYYKIGITFESKTVEERIKEHSWSCCTYIRYCLGWTNRPQAILQHSESRHVPQPLMIVMPLVAQLGEEARQPAVMQREPLADEPPPECSDPPTICIGRRNP